MNGNGNGSKKVSSNKNNKNDKNNKSKYNKKSNNVKDNNDGSKTSRRTKKDREQHGERSTCEVPLVFIHGVGLGIAPYIHVLR